MILSWGWQLFSRAQDFVELQVCDVRRVKEGLEVTIRYAKNEPRGLTRTAVLEAAGGVECPMVLFDEYVAAMGWSEADCAHCKRSRGAATALRVLSRFMPGYLQTWGRLTQADQHGYNDEQGPRVVPWVGS